MRYFICALVDTIDYFLESLHIHKYLSTLWHHARDDNLVVLASVNRRYDSGEDRMAPEPPGPRVFSRAIRSTLLPSPF